MARLIQQAFRVCRDMMAERKIAPPDDRERMLIEELRTDCRAFLTGMGSGSTGIQPCWLDNQLRLARLALCRDPRLFLHWDVVRRTMFADDEPYVQPELSHLRAAQDWQTRWSIALHESPIGAPPAYRGFPVSSGNLIHHAYHLRRFEETTGCAVADFSQVFEFGGGYGSMCRLVFQLGFKGTYTILDLPVFSALQRFFLKSLNLPVASDSSERIVLLNTARDLCAIRTASAERTLFVATWSLSESSHEIRDTILVHGLSCDGVLLAYQDHFGGIDNVSAFETLKNAHPSVHWHAQNIKHLPGNRYLFGSTLGKSASARAQGSGSWG